MQWKPSLSTQNLLHWIFSLLLLTLYHSKLLVTKNKWRDSILHQQPWPTTQSKLRWAILSCTTSWHGWPSLLLASLLTRQSVKTTGGAVVASTHSSYSIAGLPRLAKSLNIVLIDRMWSVMAITTLNTSPILLPTNLYDLATPELGLLYKVVIMEL